MLALVFSSVVLVLLIACANVAGLFVSRTFARRESLAIQIALGASRAQVLQQVLAEAVVVGSAAGAVGLGLAALGVRNPCCWWRPPVFPGFRMSP